MAEFHFDLDEDAIAELAYDEDAQELVGEVGELIADNAAALAPKLTGEGAASIHAEVDVDELSAYADVSWDPDHFYMGFHELGSEHQAPAPFLRPGMDATHI